MLTDEPKTITVNSECIRQALDSNGGLTYMCAKPTVMVDLRNLDQIKSSRAKIIVLHFVLGFMILCKHRW